MEIKNVIKSIIISDLFIKKNVFKCWKSNRKRDLEMISGDSFCRSLLDIYIDDSFIPFLLILFTEAVELSRRL